MMPCSARMALAVEGEPGSGCKADCLHRALVNDYWINRHNEEQIAEAMSLGYEAEYREWVELHRFTTFKDWLKAHKKPEPPIEDEEAA